MQPTSTIQVIFALTALLVGSMLGGRPRPTKSARPLRVLTTAVFILAGMIAAGIIVVRLDLTETWIEMLSAAAAWGQLVTCAICVGGVTFSLRLVFADQPSRDGIQLVFVSMMPVPLYVIASLMERLLPAAG